MGRYPFSSSTSFSALMMLAADAAGVATPAYEAEWECIRAKMPRWHRLVDELVALPAATTEGVRAKAKLLRSLLPEAPDGDLYRHAETADRVAWSLTGDLLGLAGGAP